MNSMTSWISRLWRAARRLYDFLLPLRFTVLALVIVAFALLVSAQGYDIIANLAEDDPTGAEPSHDGQRIAYLIGVVFLAVQVWFWSRQLLHLEPGEGKPRANEYPRLAEWLPPLFAIVAFLVAIASLWRVGRNYGVPEPVHELRRMAVILIVFMLAFVAVAIVQSRRRGASDQRRLSDYPARTKVIMTINVLMAVALFLWCTFFVQSTVTIGSASLVLLAFALSVPVGSIIVWLGMRGGVPVLTFLLLWAVLISPFADNHVVETLSDPPPARPPIGVAFDRWFERLDREHPTADGRHPVFFVATEGGGIRAAYWTAAVLTSLTDTIETFDDHTFAISAVSGGALGSAVYEALLVRHGHLRTKLDDYTPQGNETRTLRLAAKQMLSHDALAPTLAAMMQPDLAQRFVPFPIFPDRARALEGGWERAWRDAVARHDGSEDDTFAGGFLAMLHGREHHLPSLFLNGTIVETGQRIVASNLDIDSHAGAADQLAEAVDLFETIGGDVRVSTAVDNSTRFTYVSPAGTLRRGKSGSGGSPLDCEPGASCEHVVDGGYFENSGSATISDVLTVISRSKYAARVLPHVIFIQFRMGTPSAVDSVEYANEALSPVRALAAVRGAHADLASAELKQQILGNYTSFELVQTNAVFPLGWLLSDRTRNLMDKQMGPASAENGANVRRIATLLKQPLKPDPVQELAARGERAPRFQ